MEAAGVAQAGHLNRALPVVVVRGISDHADGTKTSTDGHNWQPRAARHAAAFAAALAQELVKNPQTPTTSDTDSDRSAPVRVTNRNVANGNARVGIQAGQIEGGVVIGADADRPPNLAASLGELRRDLKQAHRDGGLDNDTYEAAEAELDTAAECVREGVAGSRSRLLLALRRLRGLVGEVAELAARLAGIIAAVKALQ